MNDLIVALTVVYAFVAVVVTVIQITDEQWLFALEERRTWRLLSAEERLLASFGVSLAWPYVLACVILGTLGRYVLGLGRLLGRLLKPRVRVPVARVVPRPQTVGDILRRAQKHGPRRAKDPLPELITRAAATFKALPPEEQAKQRELQRLSFAYGNLALDHKPSRDAFRALVAERMTPHGWGPEDVEAWLQARTWDEP